MFKRWEERLKKRQSIYIIPSARGFLFLSAIIVMVLTAATYNNNLIYIVAFTMFAAFVISMVQTHANLKAVTLEFGSADEAFAGSPLNLIFFLKQRRATPKRGLKIRTASKFFPTLTESRSFFAEGERSKPVRMQIQAWKRGIHRMPPVVLETYYPLGIFRAWKVFYFDVQLVVYPELKGNRELEPSPAWQGEEEAGLKVAVDGDFGELRKYQQGESYHQIAWKQYARTGRLYSRVHWGGEDRHYQLNWNPQGQDQETHLSQMGLWIQKALAENATFEMIVPNAKIEIGQGVEHARRCWRILAEVKDVDR